MINDDDTRHTLGLLIERDDDVLLWKEYELPAADTSTTDYTLVDGTAFDGCTPGRYTITGRLDGTDARRLEDGDDPGDGRTFRTLLVQNGRLRWLTSSGGPQGECTTSTPS
jgi:hypothetical protein